MKIINNKRNNRHSGFAMRICYTAITIMFFYFSSSAQTISQNDIQPYEYDTVLKGGFVISFQVDDSLQYLYLKKGKKTIVELASTSRGILYKSLGYVGADYSNYFVLVHSFGSGNPHNIELIKKKTGKNILKEGAAWIDSNDAKEILLYSDNDVPNAKDKMTLYNVHTGQKQHINFPADIFDGPGVLSRIHIHKLSGKQLVIKYDTEKGSRIKAYNL